jgi:hypothetical protein
VGGGGDAAAQCSATTPSAGRGELGAPGPSPSTHARAGLREPHYSPTTMGAKRRLRGAAALGKGWLGSALAFPFRGRSPRSVPTHAARPGGPTHAGAHGPTTNPASSTEQGHTQCAGGCGGSGSPEGLLCCGVAVPPPQNGHMCRAPPTPITRPCPGLPPAPLLIPPSAGITPNVHDAGAGGQHVRRLLQVPHARGAGAAQRRRGPRPRQAGQLVVLLPVALPVAQTEQGRRAGKPHACNASDNVPRK